VKEKSLWELRSALPVEPGTEPVLLKTGFILDLCRQ
jgi:hypothetical protein